MSAFHDIRLPLRLARGATGGPVRETGIVTLSSGREARNARLSRSRRRWEVGSAIRTLDDLAEITTFFEARLGQLHAFRFRDPMDHKSCAPSATPGPLDQPLGTGDGARTRFALAKSYADAAGATSRPITLPVAGSVRVAVQGVELATDAFAVSPLTGQVDLAAAPAAGAVITAGFVFDVPVRFDTPRLDIALDAFGAGRIVSVPVIEVMP